MVDGNKYYIIGYLNFWKYEVRFFNDNFDLVFFRIIWIFVKIVK